jgi:hypothetical protein
MPKTYLEAPSTMRTIKSLADVVAWTETLGPFPRMISSGDVVSSLHACAFVTIEIIDDLVSRRSLKLLKEYSDGIPDRLLLLAEKPAISLVQKLIRAPEGSDNTETEVFKFHIFELPDGIPCIAPGTFVEVSHGDNIADNVAWWQETSDGLPGTIFGHISIEVYRRMLLPEAIEIIEKHYHGSPEDLEALLEDDIKSLFDRIAERSRVEG